MRHNTTSVWIEAPKTNPDLTKCSKEHSGIRTAFHRQDKNSHVCKVSISVGLSHPFSPVVELDLKSPNRGALSSQKLNITRVIFPSLGRPPRHGQHVSYTKAVNGNLASAGDFTFFGAVVQSHVLGHVSSCKLNREPYLSSSSPGAPPG